MNRSLSSRQGLLLVSQGVALACLVGGAARCSSSSGGNVVEPGDDASSTTSSSGSSSGGSSGGSGSGGGTGGSSGSGSGSGSGGSSGSSSGGAPSGDGGIFSVEAGADGGCPSQNSSTLATEVTFDVGWPTTTAINAGGVGGGPGTGEVDILLLTNFTGTTTLTGTSRSCGLKLPDGILTSLGQLASGGTKILIQVPNATWDKITRTFAVTGTQSGFNIGDTLDTSASTGLLGLTDASGYGTPTADPSKAWPPVCMSGSCLPAGSFMASDLQDDDNDMNPGITAIPASTNGYALPPTTDLFAPVASQVYITSRNTIALSGMHATDCTHGTGTAKITNFDNHVVGCKTICPMGLAGCNTGTTPQACTDAQVNFLDVNRTIYGYDQTMGDIITAAHPVTGTVKTVQIAAGSSCADARAQFGTTFNQ